MPDKIKELLRLLDEFEVVDLTHTMEEKMPTFPSHTKYFINRWLCPGDPAFLNIMIMGDHTGTHFDTPAHFVHDESDPVRRLCDQIEVTELSGRAIKLTFGPFPADNSTVSTADIKAWEAENLEIKEDDIVLFDYRWSKDKWKTVDLDSEVMENWPGLSDDAMDYLIGKKIRVAGTDCASIDSADGDGSKFPGHLKLLFKGILIIENLKNLDVLPTEFIFAAFPLKIKGAGASPIRALALVPKP
jgi:kynurenine formamidase